jgi:glycosyltransferase involved in cell wall biosynthesis
MNEPTMPLVSIGMPCYNVSADVERAIRSIQDGLYSNWELVCVDDGSTDSTPEILNRIASCDARVKVYRQHNGGVSKARNSCIEHAHGKYLAWVDPDDTVEPEFLDRIISLMENEQADYCVMAYRQKNLAQNATQWQTVHLRDNYLFNSTEEILHNYFPRIIGVSVDSIVHYYRGGGNFYDGHEGGMMWRHVYRMDIIKQHNIICNNSIVLNEDGIFNCEYMRYAKHMVSVDLPLYNYIIKPSGGLMSNINSGKMLYNKISLLKARNLLESEIHKQFSLSILPMYAGSVVLSLLQMMAYAVEQNDKEAYSLVKQYYDNPVTRKAVDMLPLGKRVKFSIPLLLLKLRMPGLLHLAMLCADKVGIKFNA